MTGWLSYRPGGPFALDPIRVDPSSQEGLLSGVCRKFEGTLVGRPSLKRVVKRPQQLGASGVVQVVVVEGVVQGIDLGEGGLRPGGVTQCDRPMETSERRRRQVQEHVVEQDDLFPVGVGPIGSFGMASDDGGLQLIGPGRCCMAARWRSRVALAIALWFQFERFWSWSSTRSPSRSNLASTRARCSWISASRPATSGSVGINS